ncbi:helix-turn-helix domain-containing protein [Candidatus Trichorickettsia mobilis]|uniref:helix-turn-helix domain-containing protein n=1 Tax=Candidatus Trichorickettsia mobilis TaxID=1346319 RepID=UPI003743C269
MSHLELTRLDLIKQLIERKLTQAQVAEQLSICIRQVQRLVKNYKNDEYYGLISKKRGKPSNNTIGSSVVPVVLCKGLISSKIKKQSLKK